MAYNLLEKSELWIHNIKLDYVNLNDLANAVADVIKVNPEKILVVDVRDNHITLDILDKVVEEKNIVGKEKEIIDAVARVPGVRISEETEIASRGILGMINLTQLSQEEIEESQNKVNTMVDDILSKLSKRVLVHPTGFEVRDKMIEDTNTPYIKKVLEEKGYRVTVGEVIEDDLIDVINRLEDGLNRGFGMIITTGGVGAEDKDKTIEGFLRVAPNTKTSYIVKFQKGTGRHVKDGVKVAVGQVGPTKFVALPGPNDEVQIGMQILLECIDANCDNQETANKIANAIGEKMLDQWEKHHQLVQ
ncbi:MAG: competence/damage-inducible protein A [Eubacteriaceae bacterium]|jgi:molybdopterin biosynthesis enzyme MoaB|nr:competence/damage-inducible protein A [Eubacteriaceae bacterium]